MSRKPATTALLALALALGVSPATLAAAPYDLDAGVRVSDTTSSLGDTSSLEDAISQLASDEQVNLFVVTIDQFESPSSSSEWTSDFATLNNMGTNDVVLVIATEARQAYFMAGSTSVLSTSQQEKIYQNYIYPELANSDYEAAALAAVTGIESELGSGSVASGTSGALVGGATLLGVAAVAGGGAWAFSRSRASARKNTGGSRSGQPSSSQPLPSIEELRTRAGAQLVATDDAIAHSQQEVEFARLQYGDDEVKPFLAAIEAAKNHMQRSFQLQKQLDDEIPDTEADQRAWLNEILARTEDAQKALNEQVANFTNLRKLEETAPQALATLNQGIASAVPLFPAAQAALDRLGTLYSPSAFGAVADNISEAQARLDFARQEAKEAEDLLGTQRSQAILALRAGEEALGQTRGLLESVHHAETDLGKMAASLDNALILANRDVAQAQELARTGAGSSSQLSGAAAGVQAVLGQIRTERSAGLIDPYLLNQRLHEVRSDLDTALDAVRQTHEQERSARETLGHTLVSAQAQVSSASEYVWARRGGVKAEARTRLREAERNLTEAQQLQHSDPIAALSHANDAIRLAGEAQRIARSDVDRFNQRNGYSGGGNYNSAMLGGILLGTLLGGSNHSSGGGFGSGGFGSGGFGGGMGGGTFGGGFGGGGSWGDDGGAGGNF
ncbi:TPM domain-containing protein [Rothia nasimurium]|uniref:TPM domain-containing protein n=1 Tax=Rothia nasimurium TaxID=85336 RepID=A0A4Y9F5A4_9MICC|nr:TPM domain-containing protein [Rothia nasimurium]MBF0807559.1 TPM domain-containing protein [Rothia nasimurium]TFU23491.1 TPM domain-containing protein [Rothia nasimurium]